MSTNAPSVPRCIIWSICAPPSSSARPSPRSRSGQADPRAQAYASGDRLRPQALSAHLRTAGASCRLSLGTAGPRRRGRRHPVAAPEGTCFNYQQMSEEQSFEVDPAELGIAQSVRAVPLPEDLPQTTRPGDEIAVAVDVPATARAAAQAGFAALEGAGSHLRQPGVRGGADPLASRAGRLDGRSPRIVSATFWTPARPRNGCAEEKAMDKPFVAVAATDAIASGKFLKVVIDDQAYIVANVDGGFMPSRTTAATRTIPSPTAASTAIGSNARCTGAASASRPASRWTSRRTSRSGPIAWSSPRIASGSTRAGQTQPRLRLTGAAREQPHRRRPCRGGHMRMRLGGSTSS
jgi:hypothetical protein